MLTHIHLDMDGPIADLCAGALAIYQDTGDTRKIEPVRTWGGVADAIERTMVRDYGQPSAKPITESQMWEDIAYSGWRFWAHLPKAPHADAIIAECRKFASVSFLTSIGSTTSPQAAAMVAGKLAWVREHFPDIPVTFAHGRDPKTRHAARGHFLIDDKPANVAGWNRAAGGYASEWPTTYGTAAREATRADVAMLGRMLHATRYGWQG